MPLFTCSIHKMHEGQRWTNVYTIESTDLVAADAAATELLNFELAIHSSAVLIETYRLSTYPADGFNYVTTPVFQYGAKAQTDFLPPFVAVRMDLIAAPARPGRKFYHTMVEEADQQKGFMFPAAVTAIETAWDTNVVGGSTGSQVVLLDAAGEAVPVSSVAVYPKLTHRQFRRRWRARTGLDQGDEAPSLPGGAEGAEDGGGTGQLP